MSGTKSPGFWNIANTITVLRIVLVPIVMVMLAHPSPRLCIVASVLYIIASVSDLVDGYLARKLHLESILGAFLDPLADKLLVTGAMIMLIPLGWLPAWMVAVIVLRDSSITSLRAIAAGEGIIIKAGIWGKYKTTFENTALCFLIWHYPQYGLSMHAVGIMLMWVGVGLSVISGILYFWQFVRVSGQR